MASGETVLRGSAPRHCQTQLWFSHPEDVQLGPQGPPGLCGPLPSSAGRWLGDLFTCSSSEAGCLLKGCLRGQQRQHRVPSLLGVWSKTTCFEGSPILLATGRGCRGRKGAVPSQVFSHSPTCSWDSASPSCLPKARVISSAWTLALLAASHRLPRGWQREGWGTGQEGCFCVHLPQGHNWVGMKTEPGLCPGRVGALGTLRDAPRMSPKVGTFPLVVGPRPAGGVPGREG